MYSILIVGAGYVGTALARDFKGRKQKVFALTRTESSQEEAFEQEGILPILADLRKPETLEKIPNAHFIVLCPAPDKKDEQSYRELYLKGIGNFLYSQKKRLKPHLIVYISSTSVWRNRNGDWVDESIPPDPDTEKGKILVEAEEQVLQSGFPSVVFRLAGIYGPARNRIEMFRSGDWPKPGPDQYMNMIHLADIVSAVPLLFKKAQEGSVYVGVDDEPVRSSEFCRWLNEKMGMKKSFEIQTEEPIQGKRCRNRRLKELGFTFQYPTFREGYRDLLT